LANESDGSRAPGMINVPPHDCIRVAYLRGPAGRRAGSDRSPTVLSAPLLRVPEQSPERQLVDDLMVFVGLLSAVLWIYLFSSLLVGLWLG
jgi:hypothetical protein